jgi:glycosyltransferase involved in cell wall biosynthesis
MSGDDKITGIIGSGMIGTDPFDPRAWSGCSPHFFRECEAQGVLNRAFGVELSRLRRLPYILRNVAPDRHVWRHRLYLDTGYYDALSRMIAQRIQARDLDGALLQIGGIFHLRPLLPATTTICSFHDGNIAQARKSPYFPTGISATRIARAVDYERRVYDSLDHIFTMSHYLRQSFIDDFGVPAEKVTVIGGGVNLDGVPDLAPRDFAAQRLLFVGVDFHRKGGADVLAAFREVRRALPRAELHIVGPATLDIPADQRDGVTMHGFIAKSEPEGRARMEALWRSASLFLMPSLYEPFGVAPLEAMLYGMPCVLSDAWAFPEMVTPGVNGDLVPPRSAGRLAETLIRLLTDPDGLERMGAAGRERVLRDFTWTAVVRKLRASLAAAA